MSSSLYFLILLTDEIDKIIERHNAVAANVHAFTYDELSSGDDFEIDDSDSECADESAPSFAPPCDPEFETRMADIRRRQLYFVERVLPDSAKNAPPTPLSSTHLPPRTVPCTRTTHNSNRKWIKAQVWNSGISVETAEDHMVIIDDILLIDSRIIEVWWAEKKASPKFWRKTRNSFYFLFVFFCANGWKLFFAFETAPLCINRKRDCHGPTKFSTYLAPFRGAVERDWRFEWWRVRTNHNGVLRTTRRRLVWCGFPSRVCSKREIASATLTDRHSTHRMNQCCCRRARKFRALSNKVLVRGWRIFLAWLSCSNRREAYRFLSFWSTTITDEVMLNSRCSLSIEACVICRTMSSL